MLARLISLHDRHRRFASLLVMFVAFRGLAVVFLQPGGFLIANTPDQFYYFQVAQLAAGGQYPYLDYWMEFPPIFPWLMVAAYKLSLLIPPYGVGILWFNLILRGLMLPFEAGTLALAYATADRIGGREAGLQAATGFAMLFAPLFVFLGWFDSLVVFFLLLALFGLTRERPTLAALGIGLGFGVKLFPLAVLPAAVMVFRQPRRLLLLLGIVALCLALVFGPFLIASPAYTLAFFRTLSGRAAWESVWALLEGYRGPGVVAPLGIRSDPSAVGWLPEGVGPSTLPWTWITLAFGGLGLFLWTRPLDWRDPRRSTAFAGLTFGLMLLYAKGFSPQWAVYLTALSVTLLPGMRGSLYGILFGILLVLEWPVFYWVLIAYPDFLAAVVLARTALALEFAALCFPTWRASDALRRFALPAVLAFNLIAAAAVTPAAWRTYTAKQLREEPLADLISALRAAPDPTVDPVISAEPPILARLRPYLPGTPIYVYPNVDGTPWAEPEAWLESTLAPFDRVWLVYNDLDEAHRPFSDSLRAWLDAHGCPVEETWHRNHWAGHYAIAPAPDARPLDAAFENGIRLLAATPPAEPVAPGAALCVRLTWQVAAPVTDDYAIFVHLLAPDGSLAAQSDRWPQPPVSAWSPNEPVVTAHGLILPPDLPAGSYALRGGLYGVGGGARLPLNNGEDAVTLGEVTVES